MLTEPDASWCEPESCLCMDPDTDGRLASRSKPHPQNDHHLSQTEETGLYRYVGPLSPNQANVTNRRIRDPYVRWCASKQRDAFGKRRTVSLLLTAVYSIIMRFPRFHRDRKSV